MGKKIAWISNIEKKVKPWGEELAWSGAGRSYTKYIIIKAGHRTSLKKYKVKNESFFLASGLLNVVYGDEKMIDLHEMSVGVLKPNQVLSVPAGCPYRLEAVEDSLIIETSDSPNDSFIIIEDDYKR